MSSKAPSRRILAGNHGSIMWSDHEWITQCSDKCYFHSCLIDYCVKCCLTTKNRFMSSKFSACVLPVCVRDNFHKTMTAIKSSPLIKEVLLQSFSCIPGTLIHLTFFFSAILFEWTQLMVVLILSGRRTVSLDDDFLYWYPRYGVPLEIILWQTFTELTAVMLRRSTNLQQYYLI